MALDMPTAVWAVVDRPAQTTDCPSKKCRISCCQRDRSWADPRLGVLYSHLGSHSCCYCRRGWWWEEVSAVVQGPKWDQVSSEYGHCRVLHRRLPPPRHHHRHHPLHHRPVLRHWNFDLNQTGNQRRGCVCPRQLPCQHQVALAIDRDDHCCYCRRHVVWRRWGFRWGQWAVS